MLEILDAAVLDRDIGYILSSTNTRSVAHTEYGVAIAIKDYIAAIDKQSIVCAIDQVIPHGLASDEPVATLALDWPPAVLSKTERKQE
jgi:hypothetical protein